MIDIPDLETLCVLFVTKESKQIVVSMDTILKFYKSNRFPQLSRISLICILLYWICDYRLLWYSNKGDESFYIKREGYII